MGNAEFARYLSVSYLAGSLYKWPPLHYAECHSQEGQGGGSFGWLVSELRASKHRIDYAIK